MHAVPSRAANLQSKYLADALPPQEMADLEVCCDLLTDLLFDGSVWLDCPQNTDAACTIAEKVAASYQAARIAELQQSSN
jgi:hypothetical protein